MRKITARQIFTTYLAANILALLVFAGFVFLSAGDMGAYNSDSGSFTNIDRIAYNDGGTVTTDNHPFGENSVKGKKDGPNGIKALLPNGNRKVAKVVGVLPPDVAILNVGSNYFTLRVGEKCPAGVLNDVSSEGVYLNDEFIKFAK